MTTKVNTVSDARAHMLLQRMRNLASGSLPLTFGSDWECRFWHKMSEAQYDEAVDRLLADNLVQIDGSEIVPCATEREVSVV